jgi:hypothetical protein
MRLDPDRAEAFARISLGHVGQEWPQKLDQVLAGPVDLRRPSELHPVFHGSFDWHSCVHAHWMLARLLPAAEFGAWRGRFLPRLAQGEPAALLTPARVADRSDGKIVHPDGLNLSRAWCWRGLAAGFGADDPRRALAEEAAARHVAASIAEVGGHFMGSHWLASFAVLALDGS